MKEHDAVKELQKLQKDFDEFAYIVSHDLKAPLRAINNLTLWIEEDLGSETSDDISENFGMLKNRVNRMNKMLDALTKYSRVNRMELEIVDTNINHLINEIKEDIEHRFQNTEVEIEMEFPTIQTYKKKLFRVISELVENAAYHNSDKKELQISIQGTITKEIIGFIIKDNGKGIPKNLIDTIFNIFYTIESKEKAKTIGAGLSIVKKTIEFVKGKIEVFSVEQEGTTLVIQWPRQTK